MLAIKAKRAGLPDNGGTRTDPKEAPALAKSVNPEHTRRRSLVALFQSFARLPSQVTLSGTNLSIYHILAVARACAPVDLTDEPSVLDRIATCHDHMMANIRDGIPVYGCNTAFGAQAARLHTSPHFDSGAAERIRISRALSEGISFTDVSVGPPFDKSITRAAMLIRMNMLMQGFSGIKLEDIETYQQILNANVTPIVNQYGGIGASGDLAHNSRVLSAARQLDGVLVWDRTGEPREARAVLRGFRCVG